MKEMSTLIHNRLFSLHSIQLFHNLLIISMLQLILPQLLSVC